MVVGILGSYCIFRKKVPNEPISTTILNLCGNNISTDVYCDERGRRFRSCQPWKITICIYETIHGNHLLFFYTCYFIDGLVIGTVNERDWHLRIITVVDEFIFPLCECSYRRYYPKPACTIRRLALFNVTLEEFLNSGFQEVMRWSHSFLRISGIGFSLKAFRTKY